jgi:hypothetical protein
MHRSSLMCLIALAFSIGSSSIAAGAGATPREAVILFFQASKAGDIETIKQVVDGSFYDRRRVLLEENEDYSMFLREYYQGAQLLVGKIAMKGDGTVGVVDMTIRFPNGTVDTKKVLVKLDSDGTWKIVDDVH